jgi:hypothetical protein
MAATIKEDVSLDNDNIEDDDALVGETYVLPDNIPTARDIIRGSSPRYVKFSNSPNNISE